MKPRTPEAARLEADYLSRLESAIENLEAAEAAEILQDLRQHMEDALAEYPTEEITLTQMAQVLEDLGPPESIGQGAASEFDDGKINQIRRDGKTDKSRGVSARGRSWMIILMILLLGNAALVFHLVRTIEKSRAVEGEMVVVGFSPQAHANPESTHAIEVEFGSLVDPASVNEESIRLTPAVSGTVSLENDRFVKLNLIEPLSYATTYRVDVSDKLHGKRGEKVASRHFEFSTPGPSVLQISQSGIEENGIVLTFGFNLPILPEELGRHLELLYPNGEQAEFEPVGAAPMKEISVRVPNVKFGKLTAVIKEGLKSTAGPISLEAEQTIESDVTIPPSPQKNIPVVTRIVEVKPTLSFISMTAQYWNQRPVIEVHFNAGIDIASARSHIEVSPDVEPTFERSGQGVRILGDFSPERRYTVTLKKGLSAFEAGFLEEDITRAVFFPNKNPELAFSFGGGYLSPEGTVKIPVHSVNISSADLSIWRLYDFNIVEYGLRGSASMRFIPGGVATKLVDQKMSLEGKRNADVETLIDLRQFIEGDLRGIYGLEVRAEKDYWTTDYAIAVVTDLGVSARLAGDKALVWVTSIKTAQPVEGAVVMIYGSRRQNLGGGKTGSDGVATVDISDAPKGEGPALIVVSTKDDLSYLSLSGSMQDRGPAASRGRAYLTKGYEVMAFPERGAYRPQDKVRLSAFIRGIEWQTPDPMPVELTVVKPDGKDFLKRTLMSDAAGRLLTEFGIPYDAMTGRYDVSYTLPASDDRMGTASFVVAEYIPRTLRMKLSAPEGPLPVEKPVQVVAKVEHLFGDPARGLDVTCTTRFEGTNVSFDQKEWKEYSFGDHSVARGSKVVKLPASKLNEAGEALFEINAPSITTPAVITATIEVEVIEPGGRALAEWLRRSFHKWPFYVGVKRPPELSASEVARFDIAAVEPDGAIHDEDKRFRARLFRLTSSYVLKKSGDGRFKYEWVTDRALAGTSEGDLVDGRAEAQITPEHPGRYELAVEVQEGCPVTLTFYVQGEGAQWGFADPDKALLSLDKTKYKPGETANLEISSPFDGTALITVEKDAVADHVIVPVENGRATYVFTVQENWRPNAYLTATVIRPVKAEEEWMPHRAAGVVSVDVDCGDRELDIAITAPESARPAAKFSIEALITNNGQPKSGAAIVLAAVDEGVLALTDYKTPSLFDFFYADRRLDVREYDMYSHLAPVLAKWKAEREDTPGGDAEAGLAAALSQRLSAVRAKRVKTAVLYQGALVTDENGIVKADFDMPEYIGELRVMAFAADAQAFGSAQQALPVKSPLIARASWPRFLAPGDSFDLPVTLFNRTGEGGDIALTMELKGPVQTMDSLPIEISVDDGEEKTIHIRMKATGTGKAEVRVKASLNEEAYAESVELPVRPAATFARRGHHFTVAAGNVETISAPDGFISGTEKISLTVAASPVIELAGSLDYLMQYPYGCVEQTTSSLVPLIYLRDLAEMTMPGAVGEDEVDKLLDAGFHRLMRMQTFSGGLAYWPGNKNPSAWGSIYAADILLEARRAGHAVPKNLVDPLLQYIQRMIGSWVKDDSSLGYAAYACYVLSKTESPPITWIATLEERIRQRLKEKKSVPSTAIMHLAAAYLALGERDVAQELGLSAEPTATVRMTGQYLDSPVRELAIALLTMLDIDPDNARIPILAGKLKQKTTLGRWGTTQENAFALMALGKMAQRAKTAPTGTLSLTLPDGSTKTADAREGIMIEGLEQGKTVNVRFEGRGEVFGFINGEGTPEDGEVTEEDSGIVMTRTFRSPGDENLVSPDTLKQGQLYCVRLTIQANQRLENVVAMDLLAAGLEIENPELKGSATVGTQISGGISQRMQAEFIERRDDRIIVFGTINPGLNVFEYVVRAVTPGTYVLPPADVSCMYDPDIFSVRGRGTVVVKQ